MHHAGQTQVLNVRGAASDLGRNVDTGNRLAHDPECCGVFQFRHRLRLDVQHFSRDQIAVTKTLAIGRNHRAAFGAKIFRR